MIYASRRDGTRSKLAELFIQLSVSNITNPKSTERNSLYKNNWIKFTYIVINEIYFAAATGPAICIILASYAGCDRTAAMVYFILSMALMGGFYSGMKVITFVIEINRNIMLI